MDFFDEDTRPRFVFQSRAKPSSQLQDKSPERPSKTCLFVSLSISSIFLSLSIFYLQAEPFKSLLLWVSFSFLLGPFAPSSLTGGDVRVGRGAIIPDPVDQDPLPETESKKTAAQRRSKLDKRDELRVDRVVFGETLNGFSNLESRSESSSGIPNLERKRENANGSSKLEGKSEDVDKEWTEEDVEILKKQMAKNPVGKPGRWEAIAAAFKGRHRVESVIQKAKELGERKLDDGDSYARFLKNRRKPLDGRIHLENETESSEKKIENDSGDGGGLGWSAGEDIALLNALKAFPKDEPMRWEKVAATVPGKSKAACMKRVAELKKNFRSSKASSGGN